MNLPPLPHPHCYDSIQDFGCFDEIQMREYGALCQRTALEEATEACENARLEDVRDSSDVGYENAIWRCVTAIRELTK